VLIVRLLMVVVVWCREEEAHKQRVLVQTVKLQRFYRAHLRYMYGYAYNRKILARAKLMHR
jgi:hypothetical protein